MLTKYGFYDCRPGCCLCRVSSRVRTDSRPPTDLQGRQRGTYDIGGQGRLNLGDDAF